MTRILLLLAGALIFFCSCVTNKKYVYLQKDDVNEKKALPKDSVVRRYSLEPFEYRIQPNDVLSVRFESLSPEEFNFLSLNAQNGNAASVNPATAALSGQLVDNNGDIMYPVVGRIKVAGLTLFEIQDKLQIEAERFLESPVVKVRLLNFRVTLLGEFNREGSVVLTNNRASLLEVIGLAGGLTDLADKANLKLIRQKGSETEVVYLNLLAEDFIDSPYYYVYQNDIIIAGALRQRPYRKYFGQNVALVVSTLSLLLLVINFTRR